MSSSFIALICLNVIVAGAASVEVYNPPVGEGAYILTPPEPEVPVINGPVLFGVRPGSPFLYTVPVSGKRPMEYSVKGLPAGLSIEAGSGRITGKISDQAPKTFSVTLVAKNAFGKTEKEFRIVQGEDICLTPPMGWNSWNCWAGNVSQAKVVAAARAMVDRGLINYGWTYVNVDDTWQDVRGGAHNAIMGNKKFPDMKGMCDAIHAMGLKVGIYSTPWITSYARCCGGSSENEKGLWDKSLAGGQSHKLGQHTFDAQDATQWAEWGFDYLKYDWKPNDVVSTERMAKALRATGRDIIYSLSNCAPIKNMKTYTSLVNAYRTTGDIRDAWFLKHDIGVYQGVVDIWGYHEQWADACLPSHFPDPDMLVVGKVGWGKPAPTKLKPDEQYTHISLWCLWSAPLLIGCPVEEMDSFTFSLLCNAEVLAVNQEPLCKMGRTTLVGEQGGCKVVKPMSDGSYCVGLFNKGETAQTVGVTWADLNLSGKQKVRDLWRQKDVGEFDGKFEAVVRPHGVVLVRLGKL